MLRLSKKSLRSGKKLSVWRNSSSEDDVVLPVVAPERSPKTDCPSPVQVHERQGSGGLLSRRSVHADGRDEEDEGGGAMNWKQAMGQRPNAHKFQQDKLSGVERASRPTWRDGWNGSKRAASRAPSADRFEKKAKPPTDEDEDVLDLETHQYAGPTFSLSPDPSQLPIPFLFMKAH
ncbi:hypothetical protein QYE76_066266 [Lolium multiflorum]|uniref:Uncharacterized protein n=1 Tax=Lolium multiflorum TaxID=4521 RepID=A0AAD8SBN9_LOLMU|nr:hypothetical protein QYE76_066266 [Lolium multiflorum]